MNCLSNNIRRMAAGWLVATPLLLLLWHQVAVIYVRHMDRPDLLRIGMLFWGHLMPEAIGMAVVAGIAIGLTNKRETRVGAPTLAAIANVIYGAAAANIIGISVSGEPLPHQSWLITILEGLVGVLFLSLFSCLASAGYLAPSMIGGYIGHWLSLRRRRYGIAELGVLCAVIIGVIFIHAKLLQTEEARAMSELRLLTSDVDRNLIAIQDGPHWRLGFASAWVPRVTYARAELEQDRLWVDLRKGAREARAELYLSLPKGAAFPDRSFAVSFLSSKRVRQPMLSGLRLRYGWRQWEAKSGRYSLTLREYRPPDSFD